MKRKAEIVNELYEMVSKYGLISSIIKKFGYKAKFSLGFTKEVCDTLIEELSLSARGYNVLKRSNINTIGEAVDVLNDKNLMSFRNLGQKTAGEIKIKIIRYGYDTLSENSKKEFLHEVIELNS